MEEAYKYRVVAIENLFRHEFDPIGIGNDAMQLLHFYSPARSGYD
jgi:hypothetical protein